jgi:hypothetical protein
VRHAREPILCTSIASRYRPALIRFGALRAGALAAQFDMPNRHKYCGATNGRLSRRAAAFGLSLLSGAPADIRQKHKSFHPRECWTTLHSRMSARDMKVKTLCRSAGKPEAIAGSTNGARILTATSGAGAAHPLPTHLSSTLSHPPPPTHHKARQARRNHATTPTCSPDGTHTPPPLAAQRCSAQPGRRCPPTRSLPPSSGHTFLGRPPT